jgi:hypothetical protein
MKTEEDLKKDGWGFQRGDGFVYYEVSSDFGSIHSFCAGQKELGVYVDKLISDGERVVFTYHDNQLWKSYYFSEFNWMQKEGNLILLYYGKDSSSFGENIEIKENWKVLMKSLR